jgi:hypothetical protein
LELGHEVGELIAFATIIFRGTQLGSPFRTGGDDGGGGGELIVGDRLGIPIALPEKFPQWYRALGSSSILGDLGFQVGVIALTTPSVSSHNV